MPVYEYECVKCGAKNEFVESLGSGRVVGRKCSACGSLRLKKIASSFAFHKEVTLEDLGVKVNYQPMAPGTTGENQMPQGPPPGGCPYCDGGAVSDTDVPGGNGQGNK